MSKVIVIGAGMVGSAMAIDMIKNHEVTLTDINMAVLEATRSKVADLQIKVLDVTNKK
ncbi:3-hydroxyacyl-CoA dehydrogenase NAD-binding domain-containing protein, partial [Lutimonas sp.]|uniref:3-hydroxyacyl-CoA dehydrogenase NAD-binding domain-containing protein n=1 Tax=Lutimonas sp. TaxID=1872403 RepID=UPI003C752065